MNWKDEPATESQLEHLRRFGYEPDRPLTKGEAAQLIGDLEACPTGRIPVPESERAELATLSAYHFRITVENTKRAVAATGGPVSQSARHALETAIVERQEFWVDTCSEADKMHLVSSQVQALYRKHGCRFAVPTPKQVQAILDSLDAVMSVWDRDHPELFFQTLELNFPELLRHQPRPL